MGGQTFTVFGTSSLMLHQAKFRDSWRDFFLSAATHPGATWPSYVDQKGYTGQAPDADERERLDRVYFRGNFVRPLDVALVGSPQYWAEGAVAANLTGPWLPGVEDLPWPSD